MLGSPLPELQLLILGFEGLQNLIRFLYLVVDALNVHGYYPVYIHVWFGSDFPAFSLMATVCLAAFWYSVNKDMAAHFTLRDWRKLLVMLFLWSVILGTNILVRVLIMDADTLNELLDYVLIAGVVRGTYCLGIVIFFVISGIRLNYFFTSANKRREDGITHTKLQKKILFFIFLDSLFLIGSVVTAFLVLYKPVYENVGLYYALMSLIWLFAMCISTVQVVGLISRRDFEKCDFKKKNKNGKETKKKNSSSVASSDTLEMTSEQQYEMALEIRFNQSAVNLSYQTQTSLVDNISTSELASETTSKKDVFAETTSNHRLDDLDLE